MHPQVKSWFGKAAEAVASKWVISLALLALSGLTTFAVATGRTMVYKVVAGAPVVASIQVASEEAKKQADLANTNASVANAKADKLIEAQSRQEKLQKRMFDTLTKQGEASQATMITLARIDEHMKGVETALTRVEDNQDRQNRVK